MGRPFELNNGSRLLVTEAPGGIYNASQLGRVASICDEEAIVSKATEDQRLALYVTPDREEEVTQQLEEVGLSVRAYQDGLHQPTACVGGLCPFAAQDAMGAAMEVSEALADTVTHSPLKIGINGCTSCCVPTHTLDISVVGDTSGYRINLGGKNSQIPELGTFAAEGVPGTELARLIGNVVTAFRDHAEEDESLHELLERVGAKPFIDALSPYSQDAHSDADPMAEIAAPAEGEDAGGPDWTNVESADDIDVNDLPEPEELEAHEESPQQDQGDGLSEVKAQASEPPVGLEDDLDLEDPALSGDPGLESGSDGAPDISPKEAQEPDSLDGDLPIFEEGEDEAAEPLTAAGLNADEAAMANESGDRDTDEIPVFEEDANAETEFVEGASDETESGEPMDAVADESFSPSDGSSNAEEPFENPAEDAGDGNVSTDESSDDGDFTPVDDDFDEGAEEVDEDAFEEKLNASIEEEESMPVEEDENSEARLATVKLVEASAEMDVPPPDELESTLGVEGGFDNLEIDEDEEFSLSSSAPAEAAAPPADAPASSGANPWAAPGGEDGGDGVSLVGVDFDASGRLTLSFTGGATIALDPSRMKSLNATGATTLRIASQTVTITNEGDGMNVDVDGLSFRLPKRAA